MSRPLDAVSRAFLIKEEGFRALPYDDKDGTPVVLIDGVWRRPNGEAIRGYPTIGFGQRIWGPKYYGPVTREQAGVWLIESLETTYLPTVDRQCPGASDRQRGALTSHCYNCGTTGFVTSSIPEAFRRNAPREELKRLWTEGYGRTSKGVLSPILIGRRAREWALFCSDDPPIDLVTPRPLTVAEQAKTLASVYETGNALAAELTAELVKGDES